MIDTEFTNKLDQIAADILNEMAALSHKHQAGGFVVPFAGFTVSLAGCVANGVPKQDLLDLIEVYYSQKQASH